MMCVAGLPAFPLGCRQGGGRQGRGSVPLPWFPGEAGMEQWVSPRGIFFSDTREKKINNLLRKMPEIRPRLHPEAHSLACWLKNCPLDPLFMLSWKFSPTAGWPSLPNKAGRTGSCELSSLPALFSDFSSSSLLPLRLKRRVCSTLCNAPPPPRAALASLTAVFSVPKPHSVGIQYVFGGRPQSLKGFMFLP